MSETAVIDRKKIINKTSNDPVADYFTRLRNALLANKETVLVPFSKFKLELTKLMKAEGYLADYKVTNEDDVAIKSIEITLKYSKGKSVIQGMRKISKPGLRKYSKAKYAPRVLSGLGISILSTNQGLMTDRKARKEKVGGELVAQVW